MTEILTTTAAAKRCGVSFRTVIRWVERGELNAYRLPGRGDYRVPLDELRRFMRVHGIPDPDAPQGLARRALIVDDEPGMANAIARVLIAAKFETRTAGDGFLAGTLLHTFKPGLMTLDLKMPNLDGFGVLDRLREAPPPFPLKVLVVSADAPSRLDAARARGADAVLAKPFANEELTAAVDRLYRES